MSGYSNAPPSWWNAQRYKLMEVQKDKVQKAVEAAVKTGEMSITVPELCLDIVDYFAEQGMCLRRVETRYLFYNCSPSKRPVLPSRVTRVTRREHGWQAGEHRWIR